MWRLAPGELHRNDPCALVPILGPRCIRRDRGELGSLAGSWLTEPAHQAIPESNNYT
jgi:hypothetical protein